MNLIESFLRYVSSVYTVIIVNNNKRELIWYIRIGVKLKYNLLLVFF